MAGIVEINTIARKKEGQFISYILDSEEQFSQVGFKVMQSQENELFTRSVKVKYNGKIKLIYEMEGLKTLRDICMHEKPATIWNALFKVTDGILQIRNNGFLNCENLEVSFEYIFFDPELLKPRFIYLPLACSNVDDVTRYVEVEFVKGLTDILAIAESINLTQKEELRNLSANPHSLEELRQYAYQRIYNKQEISAARQSTPGSISLVSMEKQVPLKFLITGSRFKIGRRKDNDGVVDFTKQISRLHCSVVNINGKYGVIDENSKYGTMVNSIKCEPRKFYELHIGDELKLPEITFRVQR